LAYELDRVKVNSVPKHLGHRAFHWIVIVRSNTHLVPLGGSVV